jgi:hypothetical protein
LLVHIVCKCDYFFLQWYPDPKTISTDEAAEMSPEERAKRHVRKGGLQPIGEAIENGVEVIVQTNPKVEMPKPIDIVSMNGEQNLLQEDFEILKSSTARKVDQLTKTLEAGQQGCASCKTGYIPPSERKFVVQFSGFSN